MKLSNTNHQNHFVVMPIYKFRTMANKVGTEHSFILERNAVTYDAARNKLSSSRGFKSVGTPTRKELLADAE